LAGGLVAVSSRAEEAGVASLLGAPAVSTGTAEPAYVYPGERLRDPFVPLAGAPGAMSEFAPAAADIGPFNAVGAELKGILKTPTGRWAVLRTSDGATYMVQNGKIYDPKRKPVEGFQGIVKEKSLVILGPKNFEHEMRLKTDQEDAP
jgi:hypothetical protein